MAERKKKVDESKLLDAFGGDNKLLADYMRFKHKEDERAIRREIEDMVRELQENELREEFEAALEQQNIVYRKAWTRACKELDYDEAEFPCKY